MHMQVIDNFFPEEQFKELQEFVLGPRFPVHYMPAISAPSWLQIDDPLAKEIDAFAAALYDNGKKIISDEYIHLKPYFMYMLHKLGYTEDNLTRIRCVMTLSIPDVTSSNYNLPHVDTHSEHKSIIFYLNDSDGDTRLFHQQQNPLNFNLSFNASDEEKEQFASLFVRSGFTIEHSITPKANRLLMFDGLQYHTSGFPINTRRRVIFNINLSEKVERVYD